MQLRDDRPASRAFAVVTGAAYAALFLLGSVVGVLGCFHFSVTAFAVPVGVGVAIAGNLAMCWLGGRAMGSKLGAAVPAAGWMLAAIVLAVERPEGDIVVTNTGPGLGFLFGGTVVAGIGIGLAPSRWTVARTGRDGGAETGEQPTSGSGEE